MKKQISHNKISKKAFKRAFGPQSKRDIINMVKRGIKDKQEREHTLAFIRAADGKKIRNTSGV